jgi:phage shock protein E
MGNLFEMFRPEKRCPAISPKDAKDLLAADKSVLLIDVRTPQEYAEVRIPGSILAPLDILSLKIQDIAPSKDTKLIVYCRSGARATSACTQLAHLGYTNVSNLGGIMTWPYETVSGR